MPNVKYTDSATFRCLENLKEGSLDISLIHTGKEHCPPGHICSMPRDEFIIHFVLDGTGFYSAGGQTWSLTPGQMFVIYPNEPVTYGADETNPWTYAWIGFRGIRAHSMVKECGFSKNQLVLPAPDQKIILKHIDYMLNHKQLSKANDLRRQAYLILLLAELADFHEKQSAQNKKNAKYAYSTSVYVELAIEYIKDMYQRGIGISDIADNIGISRAYLNSSFQKELGMSAQTFLIDYKMHKAANLLVSTSLSVKEIANNVGYEDQLVFSKAFKKKFGMSPKNYKTHKEMMDKFEHDGFNADRILLYSNTKKECAFLIDFTNNRIRFCDLCYDDRLEVQRTEGDFLLSSIRGCEFLQTDAKTGGIKRIVVGTFLGGVVGAIIGAFTKGRIIKDIKLVFYFDDVIEPSKNIYLLSRTKNGSNEYDEVQHFADEVITLMKVIIARNTTKR